MLSENVQKYFKDTYNRKTIFIPNGVNKPNILKPELIKKKYNLEKDSYILFLGRLVPEKGIKYIGIEMYRLTKNIIKDIKNIYCIAKSYNKCKKIMQDFKPDYVIGFGGYVTFPVLLAASKLGIKTAIHEQNKLPGKTNKYLSKITDITFASFTDENNVFKNKVILSGNPCGQKALEVKAHDKTKLGFSKDKKLIVIVMGSLGSEIVNKRIKDYLINFDRKDSEILFITGNANYESFKSMSSLINALDEYIDDDPELEEMIKDMSDRNYYLNTKK